MTSKQFRALKIGIAITAGTISCLSVMSQNYIIPVVVLTVATLGLLLARKTVKEVIADERDYLTAGKAALLAMQIFSWISVICTLTFLTFKGSNPYYEAIGITLAFSTCFFIILYSLLFKYYNIFIISKNKWVYFVACFFILLAVTIVGLRLFSGEDNWVCDKGTWVKHGNPSFDAPTTTCK